MTAADGTTGQVDVAQGTVNYRVVGRGPTLVFVHGLLFDGTVWGDLVGRLDGRFRCVVPDFPLGSHRVPMHPDADLTPLGLARLVDELLAALELDEVTLVGNDTGGAICQLVAAHHPDRLAGLVLTNCDAYEDFLPPAFRPLQVVARVPGLITALAQPMRFHLVRRGPTGYGRLSHRSLDRGLLEGWVRPSLGDRRVRRDVRKVLKGISKRYTLEAAEILRTFDRPVLLAWGADDRFFKPAMARRLADDIPGARLELIDDARTLVALDQPDQLAKLIGDFVV